MAGDGEMIPGFSWCHPVHNFRYSLGGLLAKHFRSYLDKLINQSLECVRLLRDLQCRQSPLHLAAGAGDVARIRSLLRGSKEYCFFKDFEGRTPLDCAVRHGRVDAVLELLHSCQESVLEVTTRRNTPLHTAVEYRQLKLLRVLMEELKRMNAERLVNVRNLEGNTILHLATSTKQIQMIKLLVESNTISSGVLDVNARNSSGLTALDILLYKDTEIVLIRREAGSFRTLLQHHDLLEEVGYSFWDGEDDSTEIECIRREAGCFLTPSQPAHELKQVGYSYWDGEDASWASKHLRWKLLMTSLFVLMVTFLNGIGDRSYQSHNLRLCHRLFVFFNSGGLFSSMVIIYLLVRRDLDSSNSYWLLSLMSSLLGTYLLSVSAKFASANLLV